MSEQANDPPKAGPDGRPLGPDGRPLPGPQQMQQVMAQKRMAQQQAQVDEVVGIMRSNVEKVLERDEKMSGLDERADILQNRASQFEMQAGKLKNKFWMKNMKYVVIGSIVGLIILILIYLKFAGGNTGKQDGDMEEAEGDQKQEQEAGDSFQTAEDNAE